MKENKTKTAEELLSDVNKAQEQIDNFDKRTEGNNSPNVLENRDLLSEDKKSKQIDHLENVLDEKAPSNKGRNPII